MPHYAGSGLRALPRERKSSIFVFLILDRYYYYCYYYYDYYYDTAYCYRPSSVVCRSVGLSQ